MKVKFKLLPLLILGSFMLLGLKVADLIDRKQTISEAFLAGSLYAEDGKESEGETETEEKEEGEEQEAGTRITVTEDIEFTDTELDILQRLSERREKLNKWEEDLELRENVLKITQGRIAEKLDELRSLKQDVQSLLDQYNQKENEKIMRLVKVYENMKPKDAAVIFATLDMYTLLKVASGMKEKNLAAIMGSMSPRRAQELTKSFAQFRTLSDKNQTENKKY